MDCPTLAPTAGTGPLAGGGDDGASSETSGEDSEAGMSALLILAVAGGGVLLLIAALAIAAIAGRRKRDRGNHCQQAQTKCGVAVEQLVMNAAYAVPRPLQFVGSPSGYDEPLRGPAGASAFGVASSSTYATLDGSELTYGQGGGSALATATFGEGYDCVLGFPVKQTGLTGHYQALDGSNHVYGNFDFDTGFEPIPHISHLPFPISHLPAPQTAPRTPYGMSFVVPSACVACVWVLTI